MLSSWASASPARPKVLQDIVQRLARQHKGSGITPFEGGWAEKFSLGEELMEKVGMLADEKPTPLSLHQLYTFGRHPTPSQRLSNAQFLHRELPIRLSQRAWELMHLPHGLSNAPGIQLVSSCYALYAGDLSKARRPRNAMEEHEYTCLIAALLLDATAIPQALGLGLRDQGFACLDEKGLGDLDDILCRFFTGRIGKENTPATSS
jgi:pyruvate dehydrogenase kinase 2/3/4